MKMSKLSRAIAAICWRVAVVMSSGTVMSSRGACTPIAASAHFRLGNRPSVRDELGRRRSRQLAWRGGARHNSERRCRARDDP
jgi:hypothetical protein